MILPPAVTVHGLQQAQAALAPGLPVLLLSAPGAAAYAGAGWWRALVAAALDGRAQPDALDCADLPGRALEALHTGCRILILLPCPGFASVAARTDALILAARPTSLDLGRRGAERGLVRWLQGDSAVPLG